MIEICDNRALQRLCDILATQEFIALDTEFIRERTYFPALALVQVSWADHEPVLIDPLTIDDWHCFHQILKDEKICKIFHAGRQDLEIFYYQMDAMPQNVFDTQVGASMCGLGEQIGYSNLVTKLLGVRLEKSSSYSDWLKRPLTGTQLRYARDDVRYLPQIYQLLLEKAEQMGRLEWVLQEIEGLYSEQLFLVDPDQLWQKVKKSVNLNYRHTPVLRALAQWRDGLARQIDKPVRFLISDETLIELSKVEKLTMEHLSTVRGIQPKFLNRYGETILASHREARALPKSQWPAMRRRPDHSPPPSTEALADLAWLLLKEISRKASISPGHLVSKKELCHFLDLYIQGKSWEAHALVQGWRGALAGKAILDFVEGRLSIKIKNRKIIWETVNEKENI